MQKDAGTLNALMERLRTWRLPRARRLLEKVNKGELLTDEDIAFLKRAYEDGRAIEPVVARHSEYHHLVAAILDLYTEIITKGVGNENSG